MYNNLLGKEHALEREVQRVVRLSCKRSFTMMYMTQLTIPGRDRRAMGQMFNSYGRYESADSFNSSIRNRRGDHDGCFSQGQSSESR